MTQPNILQPNANTALAKQARTWLLFGARAWYASAAIGQAAFVLFILAFYYPATLSGNFVHWNSKDIITGYVAGDNLGNAAFAGHVLVAATMISGGLLQLIPQLRQKWPAFHRWNGRIFLLSAILMVGGGLWMVWVRGTYLNLTGAIGISFNALLVGTTAIMAGITAWRRDFRNHRRWALRLFVLANAVWFMRIGYMIWGIGAMGAGIGNRMDGPFDYFLAFGNSLVPLLLMEGYLRAGENGSATSRRVMGVTLSICALLTLAGSVAAWFIMWAPHI